MTAHGARHVTQWTQAEKDRLTELWNAGASETALKTTLKRPWKSIDNMRKKLGLPARHDWVQWRPLRRA